MEEIQFLRVCFSDMKTARMTVQEGEGNRRAVRVEIYSNFEEKVASKFCAVLLTLQVLQATCNTTSKHPLSPEAVAETMQN